MESDERKMPFTSHLEELRERLIKCFIAIGVGFCASYAFKEKLFEWLILPLKKVVGKGQKVELIFTGLAEAFFTYLKVAFLAGLLLAAPVILYQFWMFVAPGLYQKERRILLPIVLLSSFFFVGGALFGYFIVFPVGFEYFLGFASDMIRPLPSMKEYLNFSATMLLAFGVVFELPLVLIFLARLGIVSVGFLRKNRKYAILIIFIVAAILTPSPDVMSQVLMAAPLMVLYEFSIIGAVVVGKKPPAEHTSDAETIPSEEPQHPTPDQP